MKTNYLKNWNEPQFFPERLEQLKIIKRRNKYEK